MRDRYATILLGVGGFVFLATGATFLLAPELVPAIRENPGASADAVNDARTLYGAMEAGLGAFLAFCAPRRRFQEGGLLAMAIVGTAMAIARFGGFLAVTGTPAAHLGYGALDLLFALFAVNGMRRHVSTRDDETSSPADPRKPR